MKPLSFARPRRGAAVLALHLALAAAGAAWCGSAAARDEDEEIPAERCPKALGTLRIVEDTGSDWYRYYNSRMGSTAPLLSEMILRSRCFVIVERGTGERDMADETRRARSDEARESGTRGKGQQVVADYLLKPEIVMDSKGNKGMSFGSLGAIGNKLGVGNLGLSSNEARTVLTLVDIRSSVRLAAAKGRAKSHDIKAALGGWGGGLVGGGTAWSQSDEGQLIAAAFANAYNKLVVDLREYKAQTVEGGLGEGGALGVQGGSTEASRKVGN